MKVELQIISFSIDDQDLRESYPNIVSAINSYPVIRKTPKRRRRKPRITAGQLIEEIIADVEQY